MFPEEIEIEVLLRLPIKSLFRFKCVCKKWLSLIRSPDFVKRHSQLSKACLSGKILCFRKDPASETHVISVFDDRTMEKLDDLEWPPFLTEDVEGGEHCLRGINIMGPVNGIYCIFRRLIDRWVGTLTLWNPATKDYKHIHPHVAFPFPPQLLDWKLSSYTGLDYNIPQGIYLGFGFDHATNDYKVVMICEWSLWDGSDDRWHVKVYSLSSDSWRTLYFLDLYDPVASPFKELSHPFPSIASTPDISNALLNGVFHWPCCASVLPGNWCVLAFDIASETFQFMRGPANNKGYCRSIWVYRDTIAMISLSQRFYDLEVWVMTEYGDEDSWTMMYSFGQVNWFPLGFSNDGRIFFDDHNGQLISYGPDTDEDQRQEYGVYGMKQPGQCIIGGIHGTLGILDFVETLETLGTLEH